ncbi:MAG: hypothetical protein JRE23_00165 [Deltaproteobacteria bacterium]|nr:hypothetical protein [Deltaproteobacteria bacterium]
MLTPIVVAWIEFLQKEHNAKAVKVNGVFKVVPMTCETCLHKYTSDTKLCTTSSSVGCPTWKHKETK